MTFHAVIVAAGLGQRAGPGEPKTWRLLGGKPILRWSVEGLMSARPASVVIVVAADRRAAVDEALAGLSGWTAVAGGETRFQSVRAGLAAVPADSDLPILIHDAARPFVTRKHVEELLQALTTADGAIPALAVADTLKRGEAVVTGTVPRAGLWRAQTPQAFRGGTLRTAAAAWMSSEDPTDDASLLEVDGRRVALVPGDPLLMKLTYPEDFAMAEQLAGARRITCVGQGIDAHRFGPGDSVWLCGVLIPHDRGLVGHSDADCGLHALTDAILGAISDGDIGSHFPPSDPQWKGVSSDRFVRHAVERVRALGGRILHADITLICERPKIGPHRAAMCERLSELLDLSPTRISVKATTTEGMGFTGRQEGLMAQATVTVEVPA